MSAADGLEIPAAEICLLLSPLQQQLEAGADPRLLPLSGSLCLPASLVVPHLTLCCLHTAIAFFFFPPCLTFPVAFHLPYLPCSLSWWFSAGERRWVCYPALVTPLAQEVSSWWEEHLSTCHHISGTVLASSHSLFSVPWRGMWRAAL